MSAKVRAKVLPIPSLAPVTRALFRVLLSTIYLQNADDKSEISLYFYELMTKLTIKPLNYNERNQKGNEFL
tara:strand:+ start:52 stop:264 length:213 start_codon:yes stop_codon:yes gene_type:complete